MPDEEEQEEISVSIKWSGQDYAIVMSPQETVAVLKRRLGGGDCSAVFDFSCQLTDRPWVALNDRDSTLLYMSLFSGPMHVGLTGQGTPQAPVRKGEGPKALCPS